MKSQGKRNCDLAREFMVGELTVRMVLKIHEQMEKAAQSYDGQMFVPLSATETVQIQK